MTNFPKSYTAPAATYLDTQGGMTIWQHCASTIAIYNMVVFLLLKKSFMVLPSIEIEFVFKLRERDETVNWSSSQVSILTTDTS